MSSSMSGYTGYQKQKGDIIPKGYKTGQLQQFTPEQMQLFQSLFSQVGPESFLAKLAGGDQSLFGEIEAPALKQFSGLQGQLASRFSGMGSGARRSSGFQNTMSQASSDFASELQSKRQNLQRQALMDLMGLSSNLLQQQPFEKFLVEKQKKPSFWQQLLGGAAPAAGAGLGGLFGGVPGAQLGGSLGASFGQGLMG